MSPVVSGGTGPGEGGTGYRNDAITPSRGGDPWKTAETQKSYVDREIFGATLHVDADIGSMHLVSVTDYQNADKFYLEAVTASPVDGVLFYQGSDLDQFSQEFRLSGSTGANQWVAGLYGMKVDGDYTGKFADPFYGYDPTIEMMQKTTSYAAFAQDEWQFAEAWKLTAGVRYWYDEREGGYFGTAPEVPGLSFPVTIIFNDHEVFPLGSTITPDDASTTFRRRHGAVAARLEGVRRRAGLCSFNRGSKSGGYTFSTGTPVRRRRQPGRPARFPRGHAVRRRNAGCIRTRHQVIARRHDDAQRQCVLLRLCRLPGVRAVRAVQTVINLDAEETGLEAEINSHPVEGLTLQLGVSFLDSTVKDVPLPDGVTIEITTCRRLRNSRATRSLAMSSRSAAAGSVCRRTCSIRRNSASPVLCAPVEHEDSYAVGNARISYDSNASWSVAAFVNNITEEKYRVYAFDSSLFAGVVAGVYAKPRTYGISGTYRFGAMR
jgi:iron complex outermembrane receptor protein